MAAQTTWKVTSQVPAIWLGGNGQAVNGIEVFFTTGAGHSGSVKLPETAYSVDNARTAIAARAQLLDAVGSLSG